MDTKYRFLVANRGTRYRFSDRFADIRAAGSVNDSPATPGPADRVGVDTESQLSISGGVAVFAGGKAVPAWGDPKLLYTKTDGSGWARPAGYDSGYEFTFDVSADTDAKCLVGLVSATTSTGDPTNAATKHGMLLNDDGKIDIIVAGATVKADAATLVNGTTYRLRFIVYATGCTYSISGGTFGTLGVAYTSLYEDITDTTATLYPCVSNYNAAFTLDNVNSPSAEQEVGLIERVAGYPGFFNAWTMQDQPPSGILTAYPNTLYNGVNHGIEMGIPTGLPGGISSSGRFDGTLDYGEIWKPELAAAWPDPNTTPISMIAVVRMAAGEWDTGTVRFVGSFGVDDANRIMITKPVANYLSVTAVFGGSSKGSTKVGITALDWVVVGGVVNKPGTGVKMFYNGVQESAVAITGTFVGAINNTRTALGSRIGTAFSGGWYGDYALLAVGFDDWSAYMLPFTQRLGLA